MKKLALVLLVALCTAAPGFSEGKSAVNFNVLGVLLNVWSGSFETVVPGVPNVAVKGDLAYSPNFFWISNLSLLSLNVEGRYYLGSMLPKGLPEFLYGEALRGVYAGAGVGFYSVGYSTTSGTDKYEGSYLSPDLLVEVGDKYFLDKNFYIEGFAGYDVVVPATWTWKLNGSTISSWSGYTNAYSVGGPRLGANLGYAF